MEKGQIYLHVLRLGLSHKKKTKPNRNGALNLFFDLVRIEYPVELFLTSIEPRLYKSGLLL